MRTPAEIVGDVCSATAGFFFVLHSVEQFCLRLIAPSIHR